MWGQIAQVSPNVVAVSTKIALVSLIQIVQNKQENANRNHFSENSSNTCWTMAQLSQSRHYKGSVLFTCSGEPNSKTALTYHDPETEAAT